MGMKSNGILLIILKLHIAFILLPIDRYTTSNTNIWKWILIPFNDLLGLIIISNILPILSNTSTKQLRPTMNFTSPINHKIITVLTDRLIFYITLDYGNSPTFMIWVLLEYTCHILIKEKPLITCLLEVFLIL